MEQQQRVRQCGRTLPSSCQDAVGRDQKGWGLKSGKEIGWQCSKDSLCLRDVASWATWLRLGAVLGHFCYEMEMTT